eukprot:XP_001701691.1 predicted protein [Chlamydomonas reinhardtii]
MPGGAVAVPRGEEVVAVINKLRRSCRDQLTLVVFTQDYHPPNHVSFASTHLPPPPPPQLAATAPQPPPSTDSVDQPPQPQPGARHGFVGVGAEEGALLAAAVGAVAQISAAGGDGDKGKGGGGAQQLLQKEEGDAAAVGNGASGLCSPLLAQRSSLVGASGATLQRHLEAKMEQRRLHASTTARPPRLWQGWRLHQTPLHRQLRAAGVSRLLVAGVAAEHCVLWTVRDAVRLGYQVWVVSDGVISAAAAWPNAEGLALEPPAAPDPHGQQPHPIQ